MTLAVLKPVELQRSSVNEMLDQTLRQTLGHYANEHRSTLARLQLTQRTFDRKLNRIRNRQDAIQREAAARAHELAKPPVLPYVRQAKLDAAAATTATAAKVKVETQVPERGMTLWDKTKNDIGLMQILQLGRISEYNNNKLGLLLKSRSHTNLNLCKAKGKAKVKVKDDDEDSEFAEQQQQQQQQFTKCMVELRHFCPCYVCYDRIKGNNGDRPLTRAEMKAVDFVKKHSAKNGRAKTAPQITC